MICRLVREIRKFQAFAMNFIPDYYTMLRDSREIFHLTRGTEARPRPVPDRWKRSRSCSNDRKLLALRCQDRALSLTSFVSRFHPPTREPRHVVRLARTPHVGNVSGWRLWTVKFKSFRQRHFLFQYFLNLEILLSGALHAALVEPLFSRETTKIIFPRHPLLEKLTIQRLLPIRFKIALLIARDRAF